MYSEQVIWIMPCTLLNCVAKYLNFMKQLYQKIVQQSRTQSLRKNLSKKKKAYAKNNENYEHVYTAYNLVGYCSGPFWLYRARLPPAVLGPSILSKGVETDPIATQFSLTCAQTMPRLPRARLRRAKLF